LRDSISLILESKLRISENKGFGQVVVYAELVCMGREDVLQRCVLFDINGFWLVLFAGRIAEDIMNVRWTDGGSVATMQKYH
jgi:hypothetical protein